MDIASTIDIIEIIQPLMFLNTYIVQVYVNRHDVHDVWIDKTTVIAPILTLFEQ